MTFARPIILLVLLLPAFLLIWELLRKGKHVPLPVDLTDPAEPRIAPRIIGLANLCPALLLALAIVILAGPLRPGKPQNERVLTNIEFCLDVSV